MPTQRDYLGYSHIGVQSSGDWALYSALSSCLETKNVFCGKHNLKQFPLTVSISNLSPIWTTDANAMDYLDLPFFGWFFWSWNTNNQARRAVYRPESTSVVSKTSNTSYWPPQSLISSHLKCGCRRHMTTFKLAILEWNPRAHTWTSRPVELSTDQNRPLVVSKTYTQSHWLLPL